MSAAGLSVVLTADRTLTADYRLLFDGMLAASQTTTAPPGLLAPLLMPRRAGVNGRAAMAPLGLRRIEAALLDGGFGPDEVGVVDEAQLAGAIGPATRIVAVSSGEPAGLGMNSSTMVAVAGGRIYPEAMFRRLMHRISAVCRQRQARPKVVLGGPGAWQLAESAALRAELGIDHVVVGYAEANAAEVFRGLLDGHDPGPVVRGTWRPETRIPPIRAASTMGVVEISRGCGLGCGFCTIARVPMVHLPVETILADARTNIAAGISSIAALSEDFFRYGASGLRCDPAALLALLRQLRSLGGVRLIQIDHANVLSVAQFTDEQLSEVRGLLAGPHDVRYLWVNVGVETASGELLRANGGGAKLGRCPPGEWGAHCITHLRRLCRAGFFPMVSLMLGLEGETDEHLRQTLGLVESLSNERISVFPLLHASIRGGRPLGVADLGPLHWKIIKAAYRLNFRWIPRMYWDNQGAAGVAVAKRLLLQAMGLGQVVQWKALFEWHSRLRKCLD